MKLKRLAGSILKRVSRGKKALLVHVDCDLYSSSKWVLTKLFEHNVIQDGSVVICDDWMRSFGNPNVGQRKALKDTLEQFPNWQFEPFLNYGLGSQAFIVHDVRSKNEKKSAYHENFSSCIS